MSISEFVSFCSSLSCLLVVVSVPCALIKKHVSTGSFCDILDCGFCMEVNFLSSEKTQLDRRTFRFYQSNSM